MNQDIYDKGILAIRNRLSEMDRLFNEKKMTAAQYNEGLAQLRKRFDILTAKKHAANKAAIEKAAAKKAAVKSPDEIKAERNAAARARRAAKADIAASDLRTPTVAEQVATVTENNKTFVPDKGGDPLGRKSAPLVKGQRLGRRAKLTLKDVVHSDGFVDVNKLKLLRKNQPRLVTPEVFAKYMKQAEGNKAIIAARNAQNAISPIMQDGKVDLRALQAAWDHKIITRSELIDYTIEANRQASGVRRARFEKFLRENGLEGFAKNRAAVKSVAAAPKNAEVQARLQQVAARRAANGQAVANPVVADKVATDKVAAKKVVAKKVAAPADKPAKPVKPTKPAATAKPSKPTKPATVKSTKPAKPGKSVVADGKVRVKGGTESFAKPRHSDFSSSAAGRQLIDDYKSGKISRADLATKMRDWQAKNLPRVSSGKELVPVTKAVDVASKLSKFGKIASVGGKVLGVAGTAAMGYDLVTDPLGKKKTSDMEQWYKDHPHASPLDALKAATKAAILGDPYDGEKPGMRGRVDRQARRKALNKATGNMTGSINARNTGGALQRATANKKTVGAGGTSGKPLGKNVVVIKHGDTLWDISRKHNVPLSSLYKANPIIDQRRKAGKVTIFAGSKVHIPKGK